MRRGLALSALLALSVGPAYAEDKTDFAAELKKIENASRQGMLGPGGRFDQTKARAAQTKANADLEQLAKKAEAADPKTMTPEDMAAVAQANLRTKRYDAAIKWSELAIKADAKLPSAHEAKVRTLVLMQKLDDAEKALAGSPALNPQMKAQLHQALYQAMFSKGNHDGAIRHLKPYVEYIRGMVKTNPLYATTFANMSRQLLTLHAQAKKLDEGLKDADASIAFLRMSAAEKPALWGAATDLQLAVADFLRDAGRKSDADRLIKEETASVEKAFADAAGEARAVQLGRKAKVMEATAESADDASAAKIRTDVMAILVDEATKHRKEPAMVKAATTSLMTAANSWAFSAPKASQAASAKLKELLTTLGDDVVAADRSRLTQQANALNRTVTAAVEREALVGKPMPEPNADAWINGSPISPADLKGKVVLIDFWAVWCGPCIATFPHLREWNEHFAKDGLVIVGATKYYKYKWDAEQKRSVRVQEDLSKEDERKETEKFLAHHQLKHPIAFFESNDFSEAFKVTGIPQAVVIDRKGNVRLIKVGSGEANAKAIEAMIKKCLAEPSA